MHLEKTIFAETDDVYKGLCASDCIHKKRENSGTFCMQFKKCLRYSERFSASHVRCALCLSSFQE